MDIDILADIIKNLLMDKQKVAVRGMGYFSLEYGQATLSEDKKTINPPVNQISFRSDSSVSDNMIEKYYAEHNSYDLETVRQEYDVFINELKSLLKEKKSVDMPGLGVLRSTVEGDYYFVMDYNNNFLSSAVGMEPIQVKEIDRKTASQNKNEEPEVKADENDKEVVRIENQEEKSSADSEKDNVKPAGRKKTSRIVLIIILSVIVLVIIFFILLMKTDVLDPLLYSEEELELLENSSVR